LDYLPSFFRETAVTLRNRGKPSYVRSHALRTNAIVLGIVLGIVFAFVQVSAPEGLSDILLTAAFAAVLVLVIAAFLPSTKWGLVSGLVVIVCDPIGEFVYYCATYGPNVAVAMFPSVLLSPGLVALPLAGMVGGAVAAEFSPKRKRRGRRGERRSQQRA
jgi:hypothetical protein